MQSTLRSSTAIRIPPPGRKRVVELETQVLIARKLTYISEPAADSLIQLLAEVGRMLNALIASIRPDTGVAAA